MEQTELEQLRAQVSQLTAELTRGEAADEQAAAGMAQSCRCAAHRFHAASYFSDRIGLGQIIGLFGELAVDESRPGADQGDQVRGV